MLTEKQLKEELHALSEGVVPAPFIDAILTFGGTLAKDEKGHYLSYASHDYLLAWAFATYLCKEYAYHAEVGIVDPGDKRRSRLYRVDVRGKKALALLSDIGKVTLSEGEIVSLDLGVKSKVTPKKALRAYARGIFLSIGSLTRAAEGLRLELTFELEGDAKSFLALVKRAGIVMTIKEKGDKYCVMTRKAQTISDFCALMEANKSVLVLNDMMLQKIMDGNTARAGNLLLANTDKSVSAAIRQYNDAITVEQATGGFLGVPREIAEVARARIENRDVSIEELAKLLPGKITKSGLYHRLQKLHELAESIKEERE